MLVIYNSNSLVEVSYDFDIKGDQLPSFKGLSEISVTSINAFSEDIIFILPEHYKEIEKLKAIINIAYQFKVHIFLVLDTDRTLQSLACYLQLRDEILENKIMLVESLNSKYIDKSNLITFKSWLKKAEFFKDPIAFCIGIEKPSRKNSRIFLRDLLDIIVSQTFFKSIPGERVSFLEESFKEIQNENSLLRSCLESTKEQSLDLEYLYTQILNIKENIYQTQDNLSNNSDKIYLKNKVILIDVKETVDGLEEFLNLLIESLKIRFSLKSFCYINRHLFRVFRKDIISGSFLVPGFTVERSQLLFSEFPIFTEPVIDFLGESWGNDITLLIFIGFEVPEELAMLEDFVSVEICRDSNKVKGSYCLGSELSTKKGRLASVFEVSKSISLC